MIEDFKNLFDSVENSSKKMFYLGQRQVLENMLKLKSIKDVHLVCKESLKFNKKRMKELEVE